MTMRKKRGSGRVHGMTIEVVGMMLSLSLLVLVGYTKLSTSTATTTTRTVPEGVSRIKATIRTPEYHFQSPSLPKGILFLAHGCQHSMTDWWPKSNDCPDCIGLPEELATVKLATEQYQLAVVAMSSTNRKSKCWSNIDGPVVAQVLLDLQKEHLRRSRLSSAELPLYAFGASSGGHFVSTILPMAIQDAGGTMSGFISQIMAIPPKGAPVPSVYITMNQDTTSDEGAKNICVFLTENKIPAKHIRLPPLPMTKHYFSDRITTISPSRSEKMVDAMTAAKMLDTTSMLLLEDPRQSDWRSVLSEWKDENDPLVADASPLSEILNVAWGYHEMSRDGVAEGLTFLMQSSK